MKKKARSGLQIAIAVAIALLTMVSPLCAPLCAASACVSGNSAANLGSDGCHHASASSANDYGAIAAPQLCGLKELPTAALRNVRFSMERHVNRTILLHARITTAEEPLASQLSPSLWLASSATSNDRPPATTVLRI